MLQNKVDILPDKNVTQLHIVLAFNEV